MPKAFITNTATLAAATATRLSALLAAEGYTGSMIGAFLEIDPQTVADLRIGDSSALSGTTGRPLEAGDTYVRISQHPSQPVDPGRIWLFSTTGGEIGITFESY